MGRRLQLFQFFKPTILLGLDTLQGCIRKYRSYPILTSITGMLRRGFWWEPSQNRLGLV